MGRGGRVGWIAGLSIEILSSYTTYVASKLRQVRLPHVAEVSRDASSISEKDDTVGVKTKEVFLKEAYDHHFARRRSENISPTLLHALQALHVDDAYDIPGERHGSAAVTRHYDCLLGHVCSVFSLLDHPLGLAVLVHGDRDNLFLKPNV